MKPWLAPVPAGWEEAVLRELAEDQGPGDLTQAAIPESLRVQCRLEIQQPGVLCGLGIAAFLLAREGTVELLAQDGDRVEDGQDVLRAELPARRALALERTVLNYMMQLSGVATLTRTFVDAVAGTRARIVDTRKTLPGLRTLQKYAVRCGGGTNHRFGLYDSAMLKDNHLIAAGSIAAAVGALRATIPHTSTIEVECTSLDQVAEAVAAGADIAMLDNMAPQEMRSAVTAYGDKIILEASGGIRLDTVREVAETGVHLISIGALTHSAPALSMHLEF